MAEVVAGAFLSSMFQFLFDKMDSPDIVAFFKAHKLDSVLVRKLKIAMITVTGLLDHAEEKQIVVPAVKKWLDELKDVAFEADDLLDEISYEALRLELEAESRIKKVSRLFSSHNQFEMAVNEKLDKILELVEYLIRQMKALGLTLREGIGDKPSSQRTPTSSIPDDASSICGREDDRKKIRESLLSDGHGVGVICIVGSGGMGKTTLAQLVYNDKKVHGHFDIKAWVYVSEEFNVFKITKDIFSQVSSKTSKANVLGELQEELKQELEGKITDTCGKISSEHGKVEDINEHQQKRKEPKKLLLILDDVWSDKDNEWKSLLKPLKFGAPRSKIVVTTRIESVKSAIHNNQMIIHLSHLLEKLCDGDCWSMLARYAFHNGISNSSHSDFEAIGKEIAKKCGGLPLAVKTIGGLLRSKRNVEEWKKISQSNMWNLLSDNIVPALKLSYHYLPSHLKQCFAYCGIFPKGYEFYKEDLVRLWMAEGFIVQDKDGNDSTVVGDGYFNDLVSRSFFQMSGVSQKCFVMHDHMHDLARSISGEFGFILEDKNLFDKVPIKTRYLYVKGSSCGYGNFVNEGQLLRTFFSDECFNGSCEVMHSLLPKLKHIRVLSLCKYWETKLPNSISNLKHLRYLNLRRAWIRKLPQSVSSLYNLQTLILRDCKYLIELPTNMAKLINLNFLDIRGTNLQGMPPHMGNLKKLQTLTNFVLRKSIRSGIEELGKLQHIKGELSIENLQNVSPDDDLESIRWVNKENLKKLEFKWSGESKDSEHARIVLDKLRPHEKVENLCMVGYEGTKFPEWVGVPSSSLSNLVCLKLSECYNCSCLPPLGQLASLKDLSITGFTKLVSAGLEFYGSFRSQMKPFKSLTILRFGRMGQWEEWKQEDGAFPLLEELYVEECPKLIKALPTHLPCLKKLEVMGCKKLLVPLLRMPSTILDVMITNGFDDKAMLEKLPSGMHRLEISGSDLVNSLFEGIEEVDSLISALEEIELSLCAIKCFPLEFFPILKRLHINQCSYLKSLSATEEIQGESSSCHNLTELSLFECSNLKALPECICSHPSLVKLEIINCRELELFPKGSLPSKLEYVDISYCEKLKIKVISSKYEGEKETLLLPSAVTCLKIDTLQNLESLNYKGLIHLRRLNIWNCTNLQFMPECMQALLHALVELEIYYCPKLKFKVIASGNGSNYEEEETLLLPTSTLSCLTIQLLQNLESLDYEGLMNLRKLRIWDCPNLQSMPESMQTLLPFLVELKIGNCPKLEPFLKGGLPSRLESLGINGCKGAIVGLMKRDFRALPDNEVESIPEETLLPSSLTTLQIQCFPNLYYLELQHLTSLERLIILDCPNLQCIEGDRLSSLSCYVSDGAF